MRISVGCELTFECSQTMPMIVTLNVHFSRSSDLERPDRLMTNRAVPIEGYRDTFGNWCSRLVAPAGRFTLETDAIVRDPGVPDPVDLKALQHQVQRGVPPPRLAADGGLLFSTSVPGRTSRHRKQSAQ
jgi:hypothetical protein